MDRARYASALGQGGIGSVADALSSRPGTAVDRRHDDRREDHGEDETG
jgi:hypothetical protein